MAISYTVIIPAYNEEHWLAKGLPALQQAMAAVDLPGEVIVVDNNSSDRTAEVAREHGAKVVFEPVNRIARARNTGARNARSPFLIFLDADTILSPELLQKSLANLASGKCCGGGVVVDHDNPLPWFARWIPLVWNTIAVRFGLAAGCFVYCLREGFEAVGGFNEDLFASEEVWFSRGLKRWGASKRLMFEVIVTPTIVTSARKMQDRPVRNFLAFCFVLVFPWAVRSKRLSSLWYYR